MSYFANTQLQDAQNLKVSGISPQKSLRTVETTRLVGTMLNILDTAFWTSVVAASGTVAAASGETSLAVPVTTGASAALMSSRLARYVSGATNVYRSVMRVDVVNMNNNSRFWGMANSLLADGTWTDGVGFLLVGGASAATLSLIAYNGATTGLIPTAGGTRTKVDSGSFNGSGGATYTLDTNEHVFEIHYSNRNLYFYIDDVLIHTITVTTLPFCATPHFRVHAVTQNTGTIGAATAGIKIISAVISRLGHLITSPKFVYQSGTTAGVTAKTGPGNLQSVVISAVPTSGAVVTIYDGVSAGGAVIAAFTISFPEAGNFTPASFDFKGMPFDTGLFLVIATQSANVTLVFE